MTTLKPLTVIGLNSGTSMDGIDAAAFRIIPLRETGMKSNGSAVTLRLDVEMLDSTLYPLEPELQQTMQTMIASGNAKLEEICRLNAALGEAFAQAALQLMKNANLSKQEVDLIGSHGQTIWHAPEQKVFGGIQTSCTLQLGEAAIIASRTGVPVISDFRVQDMARGGQGAPLVAFADEVLFGGEGHPVGVLNIGGIANITVLNDHGEAIVAFDSGPGNMLMDRAMQQLFDKPYDNNGEAAAAGKVDRAWLDSIIDSCAYLKAVPPKTTGRELFGHTFADELIGEGEKRKLGKNDIVATLTAFTAESIGKSYKDFIQKETKLETLVLGGGGAENATLRKMITEAWPHPVQLKTHEDYGVSTKFKEALLFALLAYTTHFGIPNNVPRCTGASGKACLGKISRP